MSFLEIKNFHQPLGDAQYSEGVGMTKVRFLSMGLLTTYCCIQTGK